MGTVNRCRAGTEVSVCVACYFLMLSDIFTNLGVSVRARGPSKNCDRLCGYLGCES